MATRNTPPLLDTAIARLRSGLLITSQALLLAGIVGLLWAYLWIADAIINAPPPAERCFDGAIAEMNHCRTQGDWNEQ